jgi:Cu-Zn family superoxide dismutase
MDPRVLLIVPSLALACATTQSSTSTLESPVEPIARAMPELDEVDLRLDFRVADAAGYVALVQHLDRLEVDVIVEGMIQGRHAVSVHEYGDCSHDEYLSAGMHYDPLRGTLTDEGHNIGYLGTLVVDGTGRGTLRLDHGDLGLGEIVGRSVIIHLDEGTEHHAHGYHASTRMACGAVIPGGASRLAGVEREVMILRHYVEQLGVGFASTNY